MKLHTFLIVALFILSCAESAANNSGILSPSGFSVLADDSRVHLTWNESSDTDLLGTYVYISEDNINFDLRITVSGRSKGVTIVNLENNKDYFFKIRFKTSSSFSDYSNALTVRPYERKHEGVNVATWNIEWFYSSSRGPSNDEEQRDRVKNLFHRFEFDLVGFQEITGEAEFLEMMSELPYHSAILSSSNYTPKQSTAIAYNDTLFDLISSKQILTSTYNASRPPLEVKLKHKTSEITFYAIVMHNKAFSDQDSHDKRKSVSESMKSYIDTNHQNEFVMLLGDYNDLLEGSITSGNVSPYQNFVEDTTNYRFPTRHYNLAGTHIEHSLPGFSNTIDHIMLTNEFTSNMIKSGSVNILEQEANAIYNNYGNTVSDHYPVMLTILF